MKRAFDRHYRIEMFGLAVGNEGLTRRGVTPPAARELMLRSRTA